jgi:hypothetical protein
VARKQLQIGRAVERCHHRPIGVAASHQEVADTTSMVARKPSLSPNGVAATPPKPFFLFKKYFFKFLIFSCYIFNILILLIFYSE